jgi:hypothetical protein
MKQEATRAAVGVRYDRTRAAISDSTRSSVSLASVPGIAGATELGPAWLDALRAGRGS